MSKPVRMPVSKDRSRSEREKLRELSFKEKLEYIWTYNNHFIIGGVIAVIIIISLINTWFFRPVTQLQIVWETPYVLEESVSELSNALTGALFEENSRNRAECLIFNPVRDGTMAEVQYFERLVAMISASAIDIFILDAEGLEDYAYMTFLLTLDDILPEIEARDPVVYERIAGETVYAVFGNYEDPETTNIAGIRITDSPMLARHRINLHDDGYLCLSISTKNRENAINTIIEFFK